MADDMLRPRRKLLALTRKAFASAWCRRPRPMCSSSPRTPTAKCAASRPRWETSSRGRSPFQASSSSPIIPASFHGWPGGKGSSTSPSCRSTTNGESGSISGPGLCRVREYMPRARHVGVQENQRSRSTRRAGRRRSQHDDHPRRLHRAGLLKVATVVPIRSVDEAITMLRAGQIDAFALGRDALVPYQREHPRLAPSRRLLSTGPALQVVRCRRTRPGCLIAYVRAFMEGAKAGGT